MMYKLIILMFIISMENAVENDALCIKRYFLKYKKAEGEMFENCLHNLSPYLKHIFENLEDEREDIIKRIAIE